MSNSIKEYMLEKEKDFKSYQAESDHTVNHFEKEYPELSQEFKKIQDEMYRMFAAKHMDYGLNNISLGGDLKNPNDKLMVKTLLKVKEWKTRL